MENLTSIFWIGPFQDGLAESGADAIGTKLLRLSSRLRKWFPSEGDVLELQPLQRNLDQWIKSSEFKTFQRRSHALCPTIEALYSYYSTILEVTLDDTSCRDFLEDVRDWLSDINFEALALNHENGSDRRSRAGRFTLHRAYQMEWFLALFTHWLLAQREHTPVLTVATDPIESMVSDFYWPRSEIVAQCEGRQEYTALSYYFEEHHVYALMWLGDYLEGSDNLKRRSAQQRLAMTIGLQLMQKGASLDLAKLAAATICEGIGHYRVGGVMAARDTGKWYADRLLPYSGHVAMHHAVEDVALENLSLEALLLVYCEVAVTGGQSAAVEQLGDFAAYLETFGNELGHSVPPMYALAHGEAVTRHFRLLGIRHSIEIMYLFRTESSMNAILERARSEVSPHHFRRYLAVFETYYDYLTLRQKQNLLMFLFESLTNPEEDIRESCARLMGAVIASCDVKGGEALQARRIFSEYFERFVVADVATTPRHRAWIGHALGAFVASLFSHIQTEQLEHLSQALMAYLEHYMDVENVRLYLLKVLRFLPVERLEDEEQGRALRLIYDISLKTTGKLRLEGMEALHGVLSQVQSSVAASFNCDRLFDDPEIELAPVIAAMARRLRVYAPHIDPGLQDFVTEDPSLLYLSNLKTATPAVVKRLQIDMLIELIWHQRVDAFYVAMHFSNLLKVSAYQDVREKAGKALVEIFPLIAHEQRNDIVIELLRALEIEGYQFTKYIPPYLGQLINTLKPSEHSEILQDLIYKVKSANNQICVLVLATATACIEDYLQRGKVNGRILKEMLSILLNGLVHYDSQVSCEAFYQIGVKLFGNTRLSLSARKGLYELVAKKVLSIVTSHDDKDPLYFLSSAAAFNHLYRFMRDAGRALLSLTVSFPERVAFFPGAFDPFSLAHKASACAIRDKGYEVYLAVDEFSWSKRTQPNIVRRNIVKMSIADELDIYLYPKRLIVNIANAIDLRQLCQQFGERPVYLVVGSDVLTHASAYRTEPAKSVLLGMNHIVFERAQGLGNVKDEALLEAVLLEMKGHVERMMLDASIETISSTQIRTYVDENRDISDLTETLVQKFIYDKNLYRREPQFKDTMTVRAMSVEIHEHLDETLLDELSEAFSLTRTSLKDRLNSRRYQQTTRVLLIRSLVDAGRIEGCALFHWLRSGEIYSEFNSQYFTDYIREHASGRILVIDAIIVNPLTSIKSPEQSLLTEALAFCLAKDYSYAVYRNSFHLEDRRVRGTLVRNGFVEISDTSGGTNGDTTGDIIFVVNMTAPITLSLDMKSMIKAPYRMMPKVEQAIEEARERLTSALCAFYPGNLVLGFDRTLIYEHLIHLVCDENQVPTEPTLPRRLGEAMLVPYGEVFKRWIVPNTVTKSLHTERYYDQKGDRYKVKAFPNYLDLEIQASTIKSFNRPVILVDDLFDKGYRFRAIRDHFEKYQIPIKTLAIAILSGRGKAWLEMEGIPVKAAYFIPRIRLWFNESDLCPMLGGDAVDPELWPAVSGQTGGLYNGSIPSINLILPYVFPKYIKGVSPSVVADFSKVCLENAHDLMKSLEEAYLSVHGRNLTMSSLTDVLASPRHPEKGAKLYYEPHIKPSELLAGDLGLLDRILAYYKGDPA